MATNGQSAFVTLTRAHRDAVYEEIEHVFGLSSDLERCLTDGREDHRDREWVRDYACRLATAVRLLDQLGWQLHGDREGYVLEVDADVARFMERLEAHAMDALEDDRRGLHQRPAAYLKATEEEWAELQETRRILIDMDLDAMDAARLAQAAYRGAVA